MASTLETTTATPTPSPGDLGPVRPAERIVELDILRGFALLGICVINLPAFFAPWSLEESGAVELFPGRLDQAAQWLVDFLGSGKFNSMFSFLFGVGFAIQMERAAARGAPFAAMYLRRLLALLGFGLAHVALLWDGDVLHAYAALGLPLVLARKLRDRWLWAIVALCVLLPIGHGLVKLARGERPARTPEQRLQRGLDQLRIYGKGEYIVPRTDTDPATGAPRAPLRATGDSTYPRVVADRLGEWAFEYRHGAAWFWPILGTTLVIGFIAGRRRLLQDIPAHLPVIRKVAWWSGGVGVALAAAFATCALLMPRGEDRLTPLGGLAVLLYILNRPLLCACYMAVLVLLAQRPRWRAAMSPLAAVGRMPLTNYLVQSLVASTLFYGYGVGLFYRVGPAAGVLIALAIYAAQVACSAWWMARFRFGPLEWLWRAVTYGNAPAMFPPRAPGRAEVAG